MMLHTKYQGSGPCSFRQDFFSCVRFISLCKTYDPMGRAYFEQTW